MQPRILRSSLLAALLAFPGCTEHSQGTSFQPTGPDSATSGGGTPNPRVGAQPTQAPEPTGGDQESTNGGVTPATRDDGPPSSPAPVPEPATFLLVGVGLTGLALYRRRRRPVQPRAT